MEIVGKFHCEGREKLQNTIIMILSKANKSGDHLPFPLQKDHLQKCETLPVSGEELCGQKPIREIWVLSKKGVLQLRLVVEEATDGDTKQKVGFHIRGEDDKQSGQKDHEVHGAHSAQLLRVLYSQEPA